MRCDKIWLNAHLATLGEAGSVPNGVIAAKDGRILYAGPMADAPPLAAPVTIDCQGRWVTPGLIDCHTHLIHGGDRSREFELRLAGATYEDIAKAGGGIISTMVATRDATESSLVDLALPKLDSLIAEGTTTVEIKSGYGLTLADELKMLRAARRLGTERRVSVVTTFLGAHALPPEFAGNADGYITAVCEEMIPAVAEEGLASAVDVFCDAIGFSIKQTERVFEAAKTHGMRVKLHAEQLSNSHGAVLAAEYGALSADHLEHLDSEGIDAMAMAGTAAVLLPGAYYFMRETKLPPISEMRAARIPMALATDCNPGTSPLSSLLLAMNMGATLFRLTVDECIAGVTRNAAIALGVAADQGTLERGKWCDLAIWNIETLAELPYRIGFNPLHSRVWRGQ